ncbi:MAG: hypothetical protein AAF383_12645 [Cyanobacteria bacterium P01_A01_bin.83]
MLNVNILDLYKLGKEISQDAHYESNHGHKNKQYLGELVLTDVNEHPWKVKVRYTKKRGRYLKISSQIDSSQKMRASADGYKAYTQITPEEWEIFNRLSGLKDQQQLHNRARQILNKLLGN